MATGDLILIIRVKLVLMGLALFSPNIDGVAMVVGINWWKPEPLLEHLPAESAGILSPRRGFAIGSDLLKSVLILLLIEDV